MDLDGLPPFTGLQKLSLTDYPGLVAAVLFFPGCNMRCPYCHNRELALGQSKGLESFKEALKFIANRAPLLGGVVISGGEPLLYKSIPRLVSHIRKTTGLKIKIDTNGMFPGPLQRLLELAPPDYIAMDIKTTQEKLPLLGVASRGMEVLKRSIRLILDSGIPSQFRSTVHPDLINTEDIKELAGLIRGTRDYVLNGFKKGNCLDPDWNNYSDVSLNYLKTLQEGFKKEGIPCRITEEDLF